MLLQRTSKNTALDQLFPLLRISWQKAEKEKILSEQVFQTKDDPVR